ncbi:hypothetical protein CTZ27_25160 [Streptomyces griseocarneus]|nr:hypothetical protein CTZ27_25160 [Streptomyces griseocarneus]
MKKLRVLAVVAAAVAALGGVTAGTAQAAPAAPAKASYSKCQSIHTYRTGPMFLEDHGWGGQGSVVDTWKYVDQDGHAQNNERWCLEPANEGGWYLHPAFNAGLCLDVPGANYGEGVGLVIWNCNGRENQRFTFSQPGQTGGFITPVNRSHSGNRYALDAGEAYSQVSLDWIGPNTTFWQ